MIPTWIDYALAAIIAAVAILSIIFISLELYDRRRRRKGSSWISAGTIADWRIDDAMHNTRFRG